MKSASERDFACREMCTRKAQLRRGEHSECKRVRATRSATRTFAARPNFPRFTGLPPSLTTLKMASEILAEEFEVMSGYSPTLHSAELHLVEQVLEAIYPTELASS